MFAPIMTPTVCAIFMIPAFTNPMTITVVAEDDCISPVTSAPASTPLNRFPVIFSMIPLIRSPAAFSSPSLMIFMPNKNKPKPPSKVTSIVAHCEMLIFRIPPSNLSRREPADSPGNL